MGYVQAANVRSMHGDTEWRHVYIEADIANKTGKVYWDGVLKETAVSSLSNLGLGYMNLTPDGTADTLNLNATLPIYIDSLNIYRRTLTEKEIARVAGTPYIFSQDESSVSVECYPENISGIEEGAQLILAMYDGSKALKDCSIAKVNDVNAAVSLALSEIDVPANYNYQLFILKSMESLTPVQEAVSYTSQ